MELLLLRHGIAEDFGPDRSDASRRLTDEGVEKTRQAAEGLARIVKRPSVILTSPKVRAAQTARIVGEVLRCPPIMLEALGQENISRVIQEVAKRREQVVMLVGHEPVLSLVAETLCTGNSCIEFIELKKAGCVCLEVEFYGREPARQATLKWLATPKMLRELVVSD